MPATAAAAAAASGSTLRTCFSSGFVGGDDLTVAYKTHRSHYGTARVRPLGFAAVISLLGGRKKPTLNRSRVN